MLCMDRSTEAGRTSTSTTTWAKAPSGVPVGPNRPCRRWSDSISRFRASSAGWLTSLSSAKSSRAHPTAITASTSLRLLVVIVVIIDTDWYGLIWIDTDWYGLIRIDTDWDEDCTWFNYTPAGRWIENDADESSGGSWRAADDSAPVFGIHSGQQTGAHPLDGYQESDAHQTPHPRHDPVG